MQVWMLELVFLEKRTVYGLASTRASEQRERETELSFCTSFAPMNRGRGDEGTFLKQGGIWSNAWVGRWT